MEEKTYTLKIRKTGTYQYKVTIPETGATKTAPRLDILKHLKTRSLILAFADQHVDKDGWRADPQERPQTDLEHKDEFEVELDALWEEARDNRKAAAHE